MCLSKEQLFRPSFFKGISKPNDRSRKAIRTPCHALFGMCLDLVHKLFINNEIPFSGTSPAVDRVVTLEQPNLPLVLVNLYGNYFGAAAFSGADGDEIWLAGEFYKKNTPGWHTGITKLTIPSS